MLTLCHVLPRCTNEDPSRYLSSTLSHVNSAKLRHIVSAALSNGGMRTIEQIRRARLAQLHEKFSYVELNEAIGLVARDSTLSQIASEKTAKDMGSDLARRLETACGKEVGWMDNDPALDKFVEALREASVVAEVNSSQPEGGEIPGNGESPGKADTPSTQTGSTGAGGAAGSTRSTEPWSGRSLGGKSLPGKKLIVRTGDPRPGKAKKKAPTPRKRGDK